MRKLDTVHLVISLRETTLLKLSFVSIASTRVRHRTWSWGRSMTVSSSVTISLRSIFSLSPFVSRSSKLFISKRYLQQNSAYVSFFPIRATCPAHCSFWISLCQQYWVTCMRHKVVCWLSSSFLRSNIFRVILLSCSCRACTSVWVPHRLRFVTRGREQLHNYWHTYVFMIFDCRLYSNSYRVAVRAVCASLTGQSPEALTVDILDPRISVILLYA